MRVTAKDLRAKVDRINEVLNAPKERGAIGTYQLSSGYGGYSLHKVVNERGAVLDVFNCGHIRGNDLFHRIDAFIAGINTGFTLSLSSSEG